MIEKDPTMPEVELLETLKAYSTKYWSASENQKFVEAYEIWGKDYSAISLHVGTRSTIQIRGKLNEVEICMKNKPGIAMSDFLHTDSRVKRQWTESERQKFNDAVRKVGNSPYQISSILGSRTYRQVTGRIDNIRRVFKKDPAMPNADVA